ncbi:putative cytochrome C oxidase assembly protein cox11 [Fasciola hepatica]|uniref:Cytochrome C oxidase assembly protein cox11 n=1 Tax=Fasciola hepatica TaxID=6192 RepID=A0A4E0R4L5_FASHE|nr:putative cytochrome C oxidase assembly protein cox11 [Fasciola hepatica]
MNASASQNSISRTTQLKECENQAKFVQQRVTEVESFFGDLCAELVSYTRRTAKLRNNGDEISRILLDYSVKEKINRSSSTQLKKVAEYLASLEDYRHAEVDRLVGKVVNPLAGYGEEIKKIRASLKTENAARKREINNRKKLERSSTAEASRLAQIQLHNAILDVNKSADKLERCVVEFEARRLKGLKNILKDFIQIEMLWHAKALETLGEAFNALEGLHEETDLLEFRSTLMRSGQSTLQFSQQSFGRSAISDTQITQRTAHSTRASAPMGTRASSAVVHNSGEGRSATQHTEDAVSLFTEGDEDDLSEEVATAASAAVVSRAGKRASIKTDVLQDLDDEDDDDDEVEDDDDDDEEDDDEDEDEEDEESERTQTVPTNGSPRRVQMQHRGSSGKLVSTTTAQSPLKSALKTGSMVK